MPKHDLGYRSWRGEKSAIWPRNFIIALHGIKVVLRNRWVLISLLTAWLPALVFGFFFLLYEQWLEESGGSFTREAVARSVLGGSTRGTPDFEVIQTALTSDDAGLARHVMWSWLLSNFLQLPQAVFAMLIVGMIAPPLIAKDLRSKAYLLYFSRPISRYEYVLGKGLIVGTFLAFITMVPAMGCYLFGIGLSSDPMAFLDTWDLPFRIVAASLIFIVPAVSVALMFSSLTAESRFAAFAWFATWGLGAVAWNLILAVMQGNAHQKVYHEHYQQYAYVESVAEGLSEQPEPGGIEDESGPSAANAESQGGAQQNGDPSLASEQGVARPIVRVERVPVTSVGGEASTDQTDLIVQDESLIDSDLPIDPRQAYLAAKERELAEKLAEASVREHERLRRNPLIAISLYDSLVRIQRWVFGLENDWRHLVMPISSILFVTFGSWIILFRRVSAPMRV